jgi:hypothetical protein
MRWGAEDQGAVAKDDICGIVVTAAGLSDVTVDRHDDGDLRKVVDASGYA